MSRIGKLPIPVPAGVDVSLDGQRVAIKGAGGELGLAVREPIRVGWSEDGSKKELIVTRPSDTKENRSLHGLTRALLANMVQGVTEGFKKELEIIGVGYRVQAKGSGLEFRLGYSHSIHYPAPAGIRLEAPTPTSVVVRGADKQAVGHTAAVIRSLRPPEPYKGKGIRYRGENVRRKAGKTASS